MFKYRISGVRKKKMEEKKKKVFFFFLGKDVWVEFFAKSVFTGQAFMLICELKLQKKMEIFKVFYG